MRGFPECRVLEIYEWFSNLHIAAQDDNKSDRPEPEYICFQSRNRRVVLADFAKILTGAVLSEESSPEIIFINNERIGLH